MVNNIAKLIKVNKETLPELGKGYGMKIHGDYYAGDSHYWDLEFPDVHHASAFAETVKHSDDVQSVDICEGDSVSSLYGTVTLTLKTWF